ncbi:transcriptional regulator PpsR [Lichenibacterium dinghuense]|uniref:transcriptional regulator PpsR n=1 Tax=Lichenibacterium dinghuense TaxID=2895977 RepID=UPI001F012045|nr:transcriptional regulator PpsR [Lichenibacterium sp. 6Y81]
MDELGTETFSQLVTASSDVALVLDAGGVVRDVSVGDPDLGARIGRSWVGRPLIDTVTVESRGKASALLATAAGDGLAWHEINHGFEGGDDLPVRYVAVRLPKDGQLVVLGRDLRGLARLQQQLVDINLTVERDYALYRSAETQFRLMFQTSTEAMLIADAGSRRIAEVNPAGEDMLHRVARRIVGSTLDELFHDENANAVADCAAAARALGQSSCANLRLRLTSAEVSMAAWLLRGGGPSQLLLRLSPGGAAQDGTSALGDAWGALSHLPEAMVTATGDLDIIEANEAFLDLVDVATANQIRSESLARFVGRHGVDMNVLTSRLQDHGAIRRYATVLRGQYGAVRDVELTAAVSDRDEKRVYAFLFRPVVAERPVLGDARRPLRPVSEMTDLVGRVPLRDIVREATDIIEELCIEAALAVTQDNRASAAEMLGLSRQSLYSKLRRYGLGDLPSDTTNGT